MFEHFGLVHNNAIRCAAVGPRPRCTTLATSTPLVMTSLRIDSPKSSRAVRVGTGPTPTISQHSSPAIAPRTNASNGTCTNVRNPGFGDRFRVSGA